MSVSQCRLCKKGQINELIDFGMQPIVHELQKMKSDKKKYPFRLGCCNECDFLQLIYTIDPEILYDDYFTLSSWKNQPHMDRLIEVSESITGMNQNSKILEIGCNDGTFLLRLRDLGYKNIVGIEPTKDAYEKTLEIGLDIENDFFSKELAHKKYAPKSFDIIITRQVLEHIINLEDFIESVKYILKDNGKFIIEVPDSGMNLDMLDYALWEEHVNYFTISTLSKLLMEYDFQVVHYETTLFSGKALTVFCEKNKQTKGCLLDNVDRGKITYYEKQWSNFNSKLHNFLDMQDRPIVIYGCGARSSTFVNFTNIGKYIQVFVDDQAEKQSNILPGSNIVIKPWNDKYKDYIVLLGVNAENEYKVIRKRGLDIVNTYSILPPSSLLPGFWREIIS